LAYKRVSPNSTFKIPLALKGLEENIITVSENEMFWNGVDNQFSEWNKNQNLNSAMKYSVNWYFQEIDKKLNKSEIVNYLKYIDYGNKNVYSNKNYWLEDSLEISPVEQVIFLKRLINNDYNFKQENINSVMKAIKLDNGLYGKTGTGMINGKVNIGWFIGIIERNNNKYIFAARVKDADGLVTKNITINILKSDVID
jgi:bla regulator protein BlaR1